MGPHTLVLPVHVFGAAVHAVVGLQSEEDDGFVAQARDRQVLLACRRIDLASLDDVRSGCGKDEACGREDADKADDADDSEHDAELTSFHERN